MTERRIGVLRKYMESKQLDAVIIPSSDPHQSEYVAEYWATRQWISGFTGSAGIIIITATKAGLWTDSRYFLQAEEQLSETSIVLHKVIKRSVPSHLHWLRDNLDENAVVGIDGFVFSKAGYDQIEKILNQRNIKLTLTNDFVTEIRPDRPPLPKNKVFVHEIQYAGVSASEKIAAIKENIKEEKAHYQLITTLDDIAWTLNMRGSDVRLNPVFIAYLIIGLDASYLFINEVKLPADIKELILELDIKILPYGSILSFLKEMENSKKIILDQRTTNVAIYSSIDNRHIINQSLITRKLKAQKNDIELQNYRQCMIKDGIALTRAFMWLEDAIKDKPVTEYEFAQKIAESRSEQDLYHDESFDAIVGYNENGAIIHYRPEKNKSAQIYNKGILLVDSGGQYHDGTTDITRTIGLSHGEPDIKQAYTAVLKGMIALSKVRFPKGTTGAQLDILARQFLWNDGKNFLHGTGHGVGFFLNVHEGPQGILAGKSNHAQTAFLPGMVTSNEPGHYVPGEYGIRIENLVVCVQSKYEDYLEFETITYFPIDTRMIENSMMTKQEIIWINDYHKLVYHKLSPHLDQEAKQWMEDKCRPI